VGFLLRAIRNYRVSSKFTDTLVLTLIWPGATLPSPVHESLLISWITFCAMPLPYRDPHHEPYPEYQLLCTSWMWVGAPTS
jgi:hypothetical protein